VKPFVTTVLSPLMWLLLSCDGGAKPDAHDGRELSPAENPFGPDDPLWAEQPRRERPAAIAYSAQRGELYVALRGTESAPMREVAVVDADTLVTLARITVGPGPMGLALHPGGRHLVVANRFASYASIIDLERREVQQEVEVPFYTEAVAFSPDGEHAYLLNRWKDALLRWDVRDGEDGLEIESRDPLRQRDARVGIRVPANPRRVSVHAGGARVLVTSETEMTLTMLSTIDFAPVASYRPNSPVIDATVIGDFVYVLHIGGGSNHAPDSGFDGDRDGHPGDGTANVGFQDVQNEIDVLRFSDLELVHHYTTDTICCRDYRDVNPDKPDSGLELAQVDAWPPERVAFLPPKESWIVAGAMPERAVEVTRPDGKPALAVVFGGSSEVQTFDIDPSSGALTPRESAGTGLYRTGFGAMDAVAVDDGRRLVVVDRLSETLTAIDLSAPVDDASSSEVVGDVAGGQFPATDAELGEAFNTVTAAFTVDGDQTCVHCHRDGTPPGKPVSMPLLETPVWGARLIMSYRSAYDSRPWFVETGMDEENFFPVINEFDRKENFCCELSDSRIWSRYPTPEACVDDRELEGCNHVLSCEDDPPPECAARSYGVSSLTRDAHFEQAALAVLGRSESLGDSLFAERVVGDEIVRRPIKLGFTGITRALGIFLLARPRTLPNPNADEPTTLARRGAVIFASSEAGCAVCHPLPVGATARSTPVSEAPGPLTFPYLVTPNRRPDTGMDVDRVNEAFLGTFPEVQQTDGGLRMGVPTLRGGWDRSRFLHDGRAATLLEVLATPGHPALDEGQVGFNETDGQPNTHGGTSHLSKEELQALVAFLETL